MGEYRRADNKGRVVLGINLKNSEWLLERCADGSIILTPRVAVLAEPEKYVPQHPAFGKHRPAGEVA